MFLQVAPQPGDRHAIHARRPPRFGSTRRKALVARGRPSDLPGYATPTFALMPAASTSMPSGQVLYKDLRLQVGAPCQAHK
jgi:hypothetical protein